MASRRMRASGSRPPLSVCTARSLSVIRHDGVPERHTSRLGTGTVVRQELKSGPSCPIGSHRIHVTPGPERVTEEAVAIPALERRVHSVAPPLRGHELVKWNRRHRIERYGAEIRGLARADDTEPAHREIPSGGVGRCHDSRFLEIEETPLGYVPRIERHGVRRARGRRRRPFASRREHGHVSRREGARHDRDYHQSEHGEAYCNRPGKPKRTSREHRAAQHNRARGAPSK